MFANVTKGIEIDNQAPWTYYWSLVLLHNGGNAIRMGGRNAGLR